MGRPKRKRIISFQPTVLYFKSSGRAEIYLEQDEIEAIRLVDYCDMHHDEAAEKMGISRPTVSRLIKSARNKISKFLIEGGELRVNIPNHAHSILER